MPSETEQGGKLGEVSIQVWWPLIIRNKQSSLSKSENSTEREMTRAKCSRRMQLNSKRNSRNNWKILQGEQFTSLSRYEWTLNENHSYICTSLCCSNSTVSHLGMKRLTSLTKAGRCMTILANFSLYLQPHIVGVVTEPKCVICLASILLLVSCIRRQELGTVNKSNQYSDGPDNEGDVKLERATGTVVFELELQESVAHVIQNMRKIVKFCRKSTLKNDLLQIRSKELVLVLSTETSVAYWLSQKRNNFQRFFLRKLVMKVEMKISAFW